VGNNHFEKPKPVSLKIPNGWGLFDMHGNVEELCLDVLPVTPPAETLVDPRGVEEGATPWCVVRGGRFRDQLHECRAARRRKELTRDANGLGVGFRVVREE
jgi:sulfatase modifying factor 1